jgi:hypothetical protein
MALRLLSHNQLMNSDLSPARWLSVLLVFMAVIFGDSAGAAQPNQVTIGRTNLVERWITNVVEVRMPTNHFVNEFRTNFVEQRRTNVIDAFATNRVVVNAFRTNTVNAYRTNWGAVILTNDIRIDAFRTNIIQAYHTNLRALYFTNQVAVQSYLTNLVDRYQTNWKTLHFTNWQTVLVMKTNWITVPVTNTVTIDLITNRFTATDPVNTAAPASAAPANHAPAASEPVQSKPGRATSWLPLNGASLTEELTLEASSTGRSVLNNLLDVQIKVRWVADNSAPLLVQQWRVERTDGSVLTFGQDPVFKRALPPGKYKVEVRARRDSRGPLLAVRGTLAVSARDAVMQQSLTAQN